MLLEYITDSMRKRTGFPVLFYVTSYSLRQIPLFPPYRREMVEKVADFTKSFLEKEGKDCYTEIARKRSNLWVKYEEELL